MTYIDMDKETTEGLARATEAAAEKIETGAADAYAAVEHSVTGTYQKIENGVVGAYKRIEDAVVGAYRKMEGSVVAAVLTREGETVEDAKQRIASEQAARDEAAKKILEAGSAAAQAHAETASRIARESLEASLNAGKRGR